MQIPDRPSLLADIARRISEAGGNIIEVSHQRLFAEPSVQSAELDVMIETRDGAHAEIIQHSLSQEYKLTRR